MRLGQQKAKSHRHSTWFLAAQRHAVLSNFAQQVLLQKTP
jgi:hypothetical protein